MPFYVVTGASRGIGFEYIKQLSVRPNTRVFGIVRNKASATQLQAFAESKSNVHILEADILDYQSLKLAAEEVSKTTGGTLDVLINNAAYVPGVANTASSRVLTAFEGEEELLEKEFKLSFDTNVIGVIHTINAFLPLLRVGTLKKVISLSSGIADPIAIMKAGIATGVPYAVSKAAMNMVVTKYAIQFKDDGFVFLALSPGLVNTSAKPPTLEELDRFKALIATIQKNNPTFTGPITPTESVELQLRVIDNATPKDSGAFLSHHGNQQWV